MAQPIKAWHWTTADRRLRYGDDRIVEPGQILTVDCEPVLCRAGLHGSRNILDSLRWAPGPYVWRCELGGQIVEGEDKLTATERTALWGLDATDVLWRFARRCALDVIHLWDAPEVVVRYLRTGDESLRAAAGDAARVAARAAAGDAARAAARAAAWAAARVAVRDAAWAAARDAARAAARAAAWAAAGDAAWAAAGDAARRRQARRLASMIHAERRARS